MTASYPTAAAATSRDRLLIVAPHMDDESIGAAAYAYDALDAGANVSVAFLTAGDSARLAARLLHKTIDPKPQHYLDLGRRRIAEAREAMHILGVAEDHQFILGYPDRGLLALLESEQNVVRSESTLTEAVPYECAMSPGAAHTQENVIADLLRVIERARPTVVVTPASFDCHPDHRASGNLVEMALSRSSLAPRRLRYVVHATRMKTNFVCTPDRPLLPIRRLRRLRWMAHSVSQKAQRVKEAMLRAYRTQWAYMYLLRSGCVRANELFFAD